VIVRITVPPSPHRVDVTVYADGRIATTVHDIPDGDYQSPTIPAIAVAYLDDDAARPAAGIRFRRRLTEALLAEVADVARRAHGDGHSGAEAVAAHLGVSRRQADRYLARARATYDPAMTDTDPTVPDPVDPDAPDPDAPADPDATPTPGG
jgi:hypothetical protein